MSQDTRGGGYGNDSSNYSSGISYYPRCSECGREYECKEDINEHYRLFHLKDYLPCPRRLCPRAFKTRKGLLAHQNDRGNHKLEDNGLVPVAPRPTLGREASNRLEDVDKDSYRGRFRDNTLTYPKLAPAPTKSSGEASSTMVTVERPRSPLYETAPAQLYAPQTYQSATSSGNTSYNLVTAEPRQSTSSMYQAPYVQSYASQTYQSGAAQSFAPESYQAEYAQSQAYQLAASSGNTPSTVVSLEPSQSPMYHDYQLLSTGLAPSPKSSYNAPSSVVTLSPRQIALYEHYKLPSTGFAPSSNVSFRKYHPPCDDPDCGKVSLDSMRLERHKKDCHQGATSMLYCPVYICPETKDDERGMIKHLQKDHFGEQVTCQLCKTKEPWIIKDTSAQRMHDNLYNHYIEVHYNRKRATFPRKPKGEGYSGKRMESAPPRQATDLFDPTLRSTQKGKCGGCGKYCYSRDEFLKHIQRHGSCKDWYRARKYIE